MYTNPSGRTILRYHFQVELEPGGQVVDVWAVTGQGELKGAVMAAARARRAAGGGEVRTLRLVDVQEDWEWGSDDVVDPWDE